MSTVLTVKMNKINKMMRYRNFSVSAFVRSFIKNIRYYFNPNCDKRKLSMGICG